MTRNETVQEELESIVQLGYVNKRTSAEVAVDLMLILDREIEHAKVMEALK